MGRRGARVWKDGGKGGGERVRLGSTFLLVSSVRPPCVERLAPAVWRVSLRGRAFVKSAERGRACAHVRAPRMRTHMLLLAQDVRDDNAGVCTSAPHCMRTRVNNACARRQTSCDAS